MDTVNNVRVIKKYPNRKLYDTRASCYVTLEDIGKMIKRGEEVTVLDYKTKADVTAIILTQILYEQEKNKQAILPLTMLKNIIMSGSGSIFEFMQKYVLSSLSQAANVKVEAERYIDRLIHKGELTKGEGKSLLKELASSAQKGFDELQHKIDERISNTLQKVSRVSEIQTNIASLTKKIDKLEKKMALFD